MKILDQFEHAIEQMVEGGVGRLFRAPVRPALVARRIETAMTAGVEINRDLVVAPNYLLVTMHPIDVSRLAGYRAPLSQQLEYGAEQFARQSGWTLLSQVRATINPGPAVDRGDARVEASIWTPSAPNKPPSRSRFADGFRLRVEHGPQTGREFVLRPGVTIIGREDGCGITLIGVDVSRQHARIDLGGAMITLTDLESTNGTRRNGETIVQTAISAGDAIRFGSVCTRMLGPSISTFPPAP